MVIVQTLLRKRHRQTSKRRLPIRVGADAPLSTAQSLRRVNHPHRGLSISWLPNYQLLTVHDSRTNSRRDGVGTAVKDGTHERRGVRVG